MIPAYFCYPPGAVLQGMVLEYLLEKIFQPRKNKGKKSFDTAECYAIATFETILIMIMIMMMMMMILMS